MKSIKGFFRGFKTGFQNFSSIIIKIVNFILLFAIYIFGVGITSIVAKIKGKRFLDMDDKNRSTYYISKEIKKEKLEKYYNQF